jgi:UDP-2,3-diacylglucosamine pyrophosphatase LpxH
MALPERFRTIWISDTHLGTRNAKADFLLDFLRNTESDQLYLVGDIIDGWAMKRSWYWSQTHNDVIQKILRKARKGTNVVFITGNHDEFLRKFGKLQFGRITVTPLAIHDMADGRRFLVLHGDQFDNVVKCAKWLALLGDRAYEAALTVNRWLNHFRLKWGYPYWSLSAYLKHKVKNAVNFISSFEEAVALESKRYKVDGVVCGHIHKAEMRTIHGLQYCNSGDWVESCTALVEHMDGRLEILNWTELMPEKVSPRRIVSRGPEALILTTLDPGLQPAGMTTEELS